MFDSIRSTAVRAVLMFLLGALAHAMPASAQVTSLGMQSEPGDYIGQGLNYFYTPADGSFTAQVNFSNGVSISVFATDGTWWSLDFAAPNGVPLTPGTYLNATRWPFQDPGVPGLSVSGTGRGCNTLTGNFQILQIAYGPDQTVAAFDATFEQHCEGSPPALRGQVKYNASAPLYLTAPTHVQTVLNTNVSFVVTATDAQSRRVYLSAPNLPFGATFTDLGNNTGTFSWTPTIAGTYVIEFLGDNKQGNQAITQTQIKVIPPPPANDDFASPVLIPSSPASYTQDAASATTAPDDPWCYGTEQSVWYAFTPPTNMLLEANTFGSNYDTALAVYTGTRGALDQIACNDDANSTLQSRIRFSATAGTKYYFMVSSHYFPVSPANLVFNLQPAPPSFTFKPTITQFGSVSPSTGAVTLSGSVQCSQPAYVTINGQLKQKRGGTTITGYWSAFVACNGVTPWTATVQSQTVLFRGRSAALFAGGKAEVGANAFAFDPDTGEFKEVNFATPITLRGKK